MLLQVFAFVRKMKSLEKCARMGCLISEVCQVVVAVLLESFYSARQQFKEEEARENTARSRKEATLKAINAKEEAILAGNQVEDPSAVFNVAVLEAAAELQLDPLMEKLADGFDTWGSLTRRIDALFERHANHLNS